MLTDTPSPALRYSINTWGEAMQRIEQDGYLFDVGQIAADVVTYLHRAKGRIRVTRDSYPIRGYAGCLDTGMETMTCFELA